MRNDASIGNLMQDLRNYVIAGGDFGGEEGRAEEFLEGVCYAVEKLEDQKRFSGCRG